MEKIKVLYLIGTAYTGSTLMAMLLNTHPDIVSLGEVKNLVSIGKIKASEYLCSCQEQFLKCNFYNELFNTIQSENIKFDPNNIWPTEYRYNNKLFRKLLSNNYPNYYMLKFQNKFSSTIPFLRNRIKRIDYANYLFMKMAMDITQTTIFFDASKCLNRLLYLLNIKEIELKIIRIGRDIRGYANSAKLNLNMPVEQAAKHWRKYQITMDKLLKSIKTENIYYLRYEDICENPQKWFDEISDFMEIDKSEIPKDLASVENHIIGNRMRLIRPLVVKFNDTWRSSLTYKEQQKILNIAEDINLRLNYHS